MSNQQAIINDELEVAEAKHPLVDLLYDYTARVVMSRPGHYVYNKFDAGLSIVEKTAKWSLPQPSPSEEDTSKTTISAPPLIRPLPWILFLPALIALRMIRYSLSLIALLIGKQPVDPVTMVSSLQNFRRKLRAFKYRGLKLKRIQRAEKEAEPKPPKQPKQANTLLRRIMFPLRYMLCLVGFRSEITTSHRDHHHHHHHHHHHRHQTKRPSEQPREVSQEPATNGSQRAEPTDFSSNKKRNAHERDADDSDSSLEEATVQELLDKYANAEADSSYHPALSSDSDSDIFESDHSQSEATAEDAEKNDPKKIKKESNGHAATNGKEPEPEAEKPHEPEQKSSLNTSANNGKPEENPKNGAAASENQQKEEKPAEAPQKSAGAGNESKPANQSNPTKEPPQDVSSKNDNQNSSSKHSPSSMKEVKTSFHQKNKQQQHQQQHQTQPTHQQQHQQHQQHQQQQHTAVNGGGGGRKHKKPHHQNAQHN